MARFMGTVRLGARARRIEVFGDPHHPVVQVDGATVYDRKPFIARDTVAFEAAGQTVTLTWRHPGLTHLECDVTVAGTTTTLSPLTDAGEILRPLAPATRRRLERRMLGLATAAGGLLALWWTYDSLKRGHPHDLRMIYAVPPMVLGGLLVALFPERDFGDRPSLQRWVLLGSLVFTFVAGYFFSRFLLTLFPPVAR